jgi:uncharacterized protein (TIGR02217 family)
MSTQVFPTLAGLGWDVDRTPKWQNTRQRAFSGAETSIAYWSYPKWKFNLTYNVLREGVFGMPSTTYQEFSQFAGFFNQLYGDFDSFLYTDGQMNSVTDQTIGTGDASTTEFQLVADFGGFVQPIFAPNVITNVKVNGVTLIDGVDYTVSVWGDTEPGIITFATPPGNGLSITATFTYYFPCRFDIPELTFKEFMKGLFSVDGVEFSSIKLGA